MLRNEQRFGWVLRSLMLALGALLVGFLLKTSLVQDVSRVVMGYAARPLLVASRVASLQGEVLFSSRASLATQLRLREEQLAEIAVQAAQWSSAEAQLTQALALLSYHQEARVPQVTARVLLRERLGQDHFLILDRGSAAGIRVYDPVISEEGILVGVIADVGTFSSKMALLTNRDTRIGARAIGRTQTDGIVEGGRGPVLVLRYVPKDPPMTTNLLMVTSGVDPQIPSDLVIGMVNAVEDDALGSFSTVFIEPLADVNRIALVSVLTQPPL